MPSRLSEYSIRYSRPSPPTIVIGRILGAGEETFAYHAQDPASPSNLGRCAMFAGPRRKVCCNPAQLRLK